MLTKKESRMSKIGKKHIFSLGEDYFAYDCDHKQATSLSKEVYEKLEQKDEKTTRELERFFLKEVMRKQEKLDRKYCELFLLIANDCNAECIYCFADQGSYGKCSSIMDVVTAKKSIDYFFNHISIESECGITFFGGEPLLAKKIVHSCLDYVTTHFGDRKVVFSITTNGTLIDEEVVEIFKKYNVNVCISIDGGREIQCNQRPLSNGENSFNKMMPMVNKLRKNDIPVMARATYYNYDIPLKRVYNELLLLGFNEIQVVPDILHIANMEEIEKLLYEVENFYQYCLDYKKNILYGDIVYPFTSIALSIRMLYYTPFSYDYSCESGKSLIAIDPSGNVYPCHRLSSDTNNVICNVKEARDWNNRNSEIELQESCSKMNCRECWNKYTCTHGCAANETTLSKRAFCEYSKKMTEVAIAISSHMNADEIRGVIRLPREK